MLCGTFTLRFDATVIDDPYSDTGTWRVTSGTGDYTKRAGEGALAGTPSEAGVLDLWAGAIQNSGRIESSRVGCGEFAARSTAARFDRLSPWVDIA